MTEPTQKPIELTRREVDGQEIYEYPGKTTSPVASKLQVWIVSAVGVALGVGLFLFLAAVFFYVFVPVLAIAALVLLVRRFLVGDAVRR